MKKFLSVAVTMVLALSMVLTGCSSESSEASSTQGSAKPIVLKLADNQPMESPLGESNVKFAELVAERTNGEVTVDVYLNGQLGEEAEITEQVKAGVLDMARINVVQLAQFVDDYEAYTLPYMFLDDNHKWSVIDGEIGQEINAELTEETDGAENDYVSYTTSGHSEVAKYYAVDRHTAGFGVLLMSDVAKSQLTEEQYAIVQECADEAIAWQREAMLAKQDSCKEEAIIHISKRFVC